MGARCIKWGRGHNEKIFSALHQKMDPLTFKLLPTPLDYSRYVLLSGEKFLCENSDSHPRNFANHGIQKCEQTCQSTANTKVIWACQHRPILKSRVLNVSIQNFFGPPDFHTGSGLYLPIPHPVGLYRELRGSASPVLTATGFVSGRGQFLTPTESTPLDRSPKNLLLVITPATPTAVPNLVQIRPRGASWRMSEI